MNGPTNAELVRDVRVSLHDARDRVARLALAYGRRGAELAEFEQLARLVDRLDGLDAEVDTATL